MSPPARPVIRWIGGWVSSLDCWEPQLRALFPDFEHRFTDAHAVLDARGPDFAEAGEVVAAWSLGSLRAHRWMAEGTWPESLPLLSLCPVFRFVQPQSKAFGESILLRMEEKLGSEREAVLRDFWRRMPKAGGMPAAWEENWIAGSRRYDDASVLRALRYLRLETVDASSLRSVPARWELIAGEKDRLAPVGDWKDALPPRARLHVHPGGHIPFWECPELMGESLRRLSSGGVP